MSKIKELAGKTASIQARAIDKSQERPPKTAPVMLYDASARMHAAEQRAEELEARLREAERQTANLELPLDELHEVPGRKRVLNDEQFTELRENLRNNDLVTPITVRTRAEGGYEIVSGHNRVAAYREIGRTMIPAVIRETDAIQADINAFYTNLLQPNLPDYEKYLGFRLIRTLRPSLSQGQIASTAGVSQSMLSRLLSFEDLPPEAHQILLEYPETLGASAASKLASLAREGKAERVIGAIERGSQGLFDQFQMIAYALKDDKKPVRSKPQVDTLTFRAGKTPVCSYRKTESVIRLDFKDADHAAAMHERLINVLDAFCAEVKAEKK